MERQCRICLDGPAAAGDDDDRPFVSPCRCTGSMQYVHRSCFHEWVNCSGSKTCEVCTAVYSPEMCPPPAMYMDRTPSSRRESSVVPLVHTMVVAVCCSAAVAAVLSATV